MHVRQQRVPVAAERSVGLERLVERPAAGAAVRMALRSRSSSPEARVARSDRASSPPGEPIPVAEGAIRAVG